MAGQAVVHQVRVFQHPEVRTVGGRVADAKTFPLVEQ